jgi:hypothetical protein
VGRTAAVSEWGFCTDSACFSIVLAPTRWKLRAAIRVVNQALAELKVQQHPDKTFVGRISRGFDFVGYSFSKAGLVGVAEQTIVLCVERTNQFYEQGADTMCIVDYVRRWRRRVRSGLDGCEFDVFKSSPPTPPQIDYTKSQQC